MSRLFSLLFMIQKTINQKIITYVVENNIFLFLWGLKVQIKTSFVVLEFGYLEKYWNSFGSFLKEFVRTLLIVLVDFIFIENLLLLSHHVNVQSC